MQRHFKKHEKRVPFPSSKKKGGTEGKKVGRGWNWKGVKNREAYWGPGRGDLGTFANTHTNKFIEEGIIH